MKHPKIISVLLFFLFISSHLYSSHIMGGEITWSCADSGKYRFTIKIYRDCTGIEIGDSMKIETNSPGLNAGIMCYKVSEKELNSTGPDCPTCTSFNISTLSVLEYTYESNLVQLTGVPPDTGWIFAIIECCRNTPTNLSSISGSNSIVIRSLMYPFNGQDANLCYDSSPKFAESPTFNFCLGSHIYDIQNAIDQDMDSLTYDWGNSLQSNGFSVNYLFPVTYASGYSAASQLPSIIQDSLNIASNIDDASGLVDFKSLTAGYFAVCIKVTSFKSGIKVAEVFREIQVKLLPCLIGVNSINTSPDINVGLPIENYFLSVGDTLNLLIEALDLEFLPASTGGAYQTITLTHFGQNFGDGDTNTLVGCLVPPCATMDPPTPVSSIMGVSSNFQYITNCAHAGFINGVLQHERMLSFGFKFKDDYCPVNGVASKIVNVYVSGPEIQISGTDLIISFSGATFQWYLNGNPIVGAIDSIYTPLQSGIYTVLITNMNGCVMISNAVNKTVLGVKDLISKKTEILIYPNPIEKGSLLNIVLKENKAGENILQVMDINGRLIKQFNVQLNSESEHLVLDVSDIASGVYSLSLKNGSEIISEGFVIK